MKQTSLTLFVLVLICFSQLSYSTHTLANGKFMMSKAKNPLLDSKDHDEDEFEKMRNTHKKQIEKGKASSRKTEAQVLSDKIALIEHPLDKNKIVNDHETLKVMVEGWMKISSPSFKNSKEYPTVILNNYKKTNIPTGLNYFRINKVYKKKDKSNPEIPPSRNDFWFRYSDRNMYYASTKKSLQVLGTMVIRNIKDMNLNDDPNFSDCIWLNDGFKTEWNVCPETPELKHKLFCKIKEDLNISDESCKQLELGSTEPTVLEQRITQPIILIPQPSKDCNEKWNYKNKGKDWECECADGKEQSPIDLPELDSGNAYPSPVKPIFKYVDAPTLQTQDSFDGFLKKGENMKLFIEDGILKIKHPNLGTVVTLDGVVYKAQEIRFHTPSEHKIEGKSYDMEIEIIHFGQSKGDISKQFVLSLLFERTPGVYNQFIEDIDIYNLPNPLTPEVDLLKNINVNKLFYSTEEEGSFFTTRDFNFYTYQGSLSAPPCTQSTIRIVGAKPIPLSSTALTLLKEAIKIPETVDSQGNITVNTGSIESNRDIQPTNGRRVYYFDAGIKEQPKAPKPQLEEKGHYEKVKKLYTSYFHVSTDKPSGLPGAFVVPEKEAKK